jgi:ribonuclease VapC
VTTERKVVLDASAAIAWLVNERGAPTIGQLLPVAVLPASAMTESLYRCKEKGHRLDLEDLHQSLRAMGVSVEPVTDADSLRAAELILESRAARNAPGDPCLSLGDGLCLAVAERLQLPVTGSDYHWENLGMGVLFLPFR